MKTGRLRRTKSILPSPMTRSMSLMKGPRNNTKITVVPALKTRWIAASSIAGLMGISPSLSPINRKTGMKIRTPPTLNTKWLRAVFLAAMSILNTAIKAVAVVPMLAPMMSGTAFCREIRPCCAKTMAIPVVTELDCTSAVNRQPNKSVYIGFWGWVSKLMMYASSLRGWSDEEIRFRLKNTKPK